MRAYLFGFVAAACLVSMDAQAQWRGGYVDEDVQEDPCAHGCDMERYSPGLMATGIALTAAGGGLMVGAGVAGLFSIFDEESRDLALGLLIGGASGVVAGIPMIVVGARKVGVPRRPTFTAGVTPGGVSLALTF